MWPIKISPFDPIGGIYYYVIWTLRCTLLYSAKKGTIQECENLLKAQKPRTDFKRSLNERYATFFKRASWKFHLLSCHNLQSPGTSSFQNAGMFALFLKHTRSGFLVCSNTFLQQSIGKSVFQKASTMSVLQKALTESIPFQGHSRGDCEIMNEVHGLLRPCLVKSLHGGSDASILGQEINYTITPGALIPHYARPCSAGRLSLNCSRPSLVCSKNTDMPTRRVEEKIKEHYRAQEANFGKRAVVNWQKNALTSEE